jgi:hypothetical protein
MDVVLQKKLLATTVWSSLRCSLVWIFVALAVYLLEIFLQLVQLVAFII